MLDAKITSALKRIVTDEYFRRRVNVEEQNAEKYDGILQGRQTALIICDNFRTNDAISQKSTREEHQRGQENGRMLFISGEQTDSSRRDCCSFLHGSARGQRAQSCSLAPRAQTQIYGRKPSKARQNLQRNLYQSVMSLLASSRMSQITSLNRDAISVFSDTERLMVSWVKSKRSGGKWSVALLKESFQLSGVFQASYPRKSFQSEPGKLGTEREVKFSNGTWHQIKIRERKGPSRGITRKCARHERSLCAPKFEERSHEEISRREGCARRAAWYFAKKHLQAQEFRQSFVFLLIMKQ